MPPELNEQKTAHWRGVWRGFGPVENGEIVRFAVFETSKKDNNELKPQSFDRAKLRQANESIARERFVTRTIFERDIGGGGSSPKGALIGIAYARAEDIRSIRARHPYPPKGSAGTEVQGFAVYDRVERGDCDGHAVIGYSRQIAELNVNTDKHNSKLREALALELVEAFSEITPLSKLSWPTRFSVALGRAKSILRVLGLRLRGRREI